MGQMLRMPGFALSQGLSKEGEGFRPPTGQCVKPEKILFLRKGKMVI